MSTKSIDATGGLRPPLYHNRQLHAKGIISNVKVYTSMVDFQLI